MRAQPGGLGLFQQRAAIVGGIALVACKEDIPVDVLDIDNSGGRGAKAFQYQLPGLAVLLVIVAYGCHKTLGTTDISQRHVSIPGVGPMAVGVFRTDCRKVIRVKKSL